LHEVSARSAALAAGLLAVAVALPSIRNEFAGDDRWVIVERPLLKQPPSLSAVVAEPYWPAGFGGVMWRPAVLTAYALDYRVGGGPHWFHAMNALWAGLATGLLTALACRLADPRTGLVAGLLFAVHPVHVEAVANVVGRAELMAAAGYGAALLCALLAAQHRAWLLGVVLAASFAIASKEHAITLPAAVVLVYLGSRVQLRRAALPALVAALPIALYFALRAGVTRGGVFTGGVAPGLEHLSLVQRGWAMVPLSLEWWRLLLIPAHLAADYSPAQVSVSTGFTAGHVLGLLAWIGAGWGAWHWRERVPGVALGLVWLLVTVSPMANVVLPTEFLVAERALYLPSWGICFALATIGVALPLSPRARIMSLAAVVAIAGARSIARVSAWHDDEAAYRALTRDAPRSYRTLWYEGRDEVVAGHWGTGERLFQTAIAAAPQVSGPRLDLARLYSSAGRWQPAVELLREAIARDSTLQPAWEMLPRALLGAGDTAAAAAAVQEAHRRFAPR
jgi:protein O-mannosyl-transferase